MSKNTTKPCVKCGSEERDVKGNCAACARTYGRDWRKKNKERVRRYNRARYVAEQTARQLKQRQYYRTNRNKVRAAAKKVREEYPERGRAQGLRRYGMSLEEYQTKLAAQGSVCAICHRPERRRHQNGRIKALAVDHNHEKNQLRDLLCSDCNQGIGKFFDNPALLRAAADYLERHE